MDDLGKQTQDWQDRNPFVVWCKKQGLDDQQCAEKLSVDGPRLAELKVGYTTVGSEELKRAGITEAQWTEWRHSKPRGGGEPAKG